MVSSKFGDPRVETGSLVICGVCHWIRGPVPGGSDGAEQLCKCTPVEARRAQPLWDRFPGGGVPDHNTYAELCRCCGLVLLKSGSKWSIWFCESCKPLVVALNRAAGVPLFPLGRHSMMAGVGATVKQLASPDVRERFVGRARGLFKRMEGLEGLVGATVGRNLATLGFDEGADVYAGKYLWTVRRSTLTPQDGFALLVLGLLSSEEVQA